MPVPRGWPGGSGSGTGTAAGLQLERPRDQQARVQVPKRKVPVGARVCRGASSGQCQHVRLAMMPLGGKLSRHSVRTSPRALQMSALRMPSGRRADLQSPKLH